MDYTLKGQEELLKNLEKLGSKLHKALEAATAAGALLVVNDAKTNAPYKTGTLRRSIHIGGFTSLVPDYNPGDARNTQTFGDLGKGKKTDTAVELKIGTDLIYAAPQEFGTSTIPAHPYLRPAVDENKDKVPKEIGAALGDIVRKVV